MRKEIYFVRHGETELNRLGIVQGSGVDAGLNPAGWHQSHRFHSRYASRDFELVITSALQRSQQTVKPFLDSGLPWVIDPRINEISWGSHEGQPGTPERIARYQRMIEAWGRGELDASLPEGESAAELIRRVDHFLEDLFLRPEQRILVCTHGRTLRCLVTRIKAGPVADMETVHHANTGLFLLHKEFTAASFLLENDLSHLHD